MKTVGIRELKQQASAIIRQVREEGEDYQVTYHGEPVALIIPLGTSSNMEEADQAWAAIDHLATEIGARWPEGVSAEEAVAEGRR